MLLKKNCFHFSLNAAAIVYAVFRFPRYNYSVFQRDRVLHTRTLASSLRFKLVHQYESTAHINSMHGHQDPEFHKTACPKPKRLHKVVFFIDCYSLKSYASTVTVTLL